MTHDKRPFGLTRTGPDPCPGPARFWEVALGQDVWSSAERRHVSACPQCRLSERKVLSAAAAWDPSHDLNDPVPVNRVQHFTPRPDPASRDDPPAGDLTITTDIPRAPDPEPEPATCPRADLTRTVYPAQTLGPYEVVRTIAQGGMGVVYQARDERLGRTVAVKVMSSFGRESGFGLDRFMAEARALARLTHPSVMPILDVGQHHDLTYIVTPYIEGRTLGSLYRDAPLDPREAARVIAEVADAVHYCHGRGVLHRDVKPSNILMTGEGRPLLMDFGLAKVSDGEASLSTEGHVIGTPAYMSPEQASGDIRAVGTASDIYSLGATLYALLTGRPPFQGGTPFEMLLKLRSEDPPRPRDLNPAVDRDLERVCLKALEKDPRRRYESAGAMAEDLRRFLAGRPVSTRPVGPLGRLTIPAWVLVVAVLTLILGAFAAVLRSELDRHAGFNLLPASERSGRQGFTPSAPPKAVTPADLAAALNDLGRLYRELDRPAQAESAYRRSAALLRRLAEARPEVAAYREGLAEARRNLNELLRAAGRPAEAESDTFTPVDADRFP